MALRGGVSLRTADQWRRVPLKGYAIYQDSRLAGEIEVPVNSSHQQTATDEIANESGNHALPDVIPHGDLRVAQKDGHWHEEPEQC